MKIESALANKQMHYSEVTTAHLFTLQFGLSALHVAAMEGNLKHVKMLVKLGLDIGCKSKVHHERSVLAEGTRHV